MRALLVAALIASHLFVVSVAFSATLHHWLHGHCDDPSHECAITAFLDGNLDASHEPLIQAPLPTVAEAPVPAITSISFRYTPCFYGAGERAPPAGSFPA